MCIYTVLFSSLFSPFLSQVLSLENYKSLIILIYLLCKILPCSSKFTFSFNYLSHYLSFISWQICISSKVFFFFKKDKKKTRECSIVFSVKIANVHTFLFNDFLTFFKSRYLGWFKRFDFLLFIEIISPN